MVFSDPDDAAEVFGEEFGFRTPDKVRAYRRDCALAIIREAQRDRQPCPALRIDPHASDAVGAMVRVDTDETHRAWLDRQRAPYVDDLIGHRDRLAHAIRTMRDEGEGLSFKAEDIDIMGADFDEALDRARLGGDRVVLSLPPWARGKVKAWEDGGRIYASVRVASNEGPRVATASDRLQPHVERVRGYADTVGADGCDDLVEVLGKILCGGSLIILLCSVAPQAIKQPEVKAGEPFVATAGRASS